MRSILACSLNGTGLGHVSRVTAILAALNGRLGGIPIVHATSSDATFVSHEVGIPTLRLNSYEDLVNVRTSTPLHERVLEPETALTQIDLLRAANGRIWRGAIADLRPELLLMDAFPAGPLDALNCADSTAARVLIQGAFKHHDYEKTLIQSSRDFDLSVAPWPAELRDLYPGVSNPDTRFSGFISLSPYVREAAKVDLPSGTAGRVLINLGGGPSAWTHEVIDCVAPMLIDMGYAVVVPTLPLARHRQGILPQGTETRVLWPLAHYLESFDFVVSALGMNSFPEVVYSKRPVLFLARPGDAHSDQAAIASVVNELSLAPLCGLQELREGHRVLEAALDWVRTPSASEVFGLDGAESVASDCIELIGSR